MNLKIYQLIPRKILSGCFYYLSRIEIRAVKNVIIWAYQKVTGANTNFAKEKNPYAYQNLNAFFTRELADSARPIAALETGIISPVDGRCAIFGEIKSGQMHQAKTRQYRLVDLLNSAEKAAIFENGQTLTLYLAPDDYHRIHMPCDGRLTAMSFCPGDKHSVALNLLEHIPNLFAANERLVCHFETTFGDMALIMVGALNVSSISTIWHGELRDNGNNHYVYDQPLYFNKGDELGQFNLGSTVILCFTSNFITLNHSKLSSGEKIHMGELLGEKTI